MTCENGASGYLKKNNKYTTVELTYITCNKVTGTTECCDMIRIVY